MVQHEGVVDYGVVYSSGTFEDMIGRRILIGSMYEMRSESWIKTDGWNGNLRNQN